MWVLLGLERGAERSHRVGALHGGGKGARKARAGVSFGMVWGPSCDLFGVSCRGYLFQYLWRGMGMVVCVVEPNWKTSDWVLVDWRLGNFNSL